MIEEMKSDTLRSYLGATGGVGKTHGMLEQGWRRKERSHDGLIGVVETHGRAQTAGQTRDVEINCRRRLTDRGATFDEGPLDGVLARRPPIALVDELGHSNIPGSRSKRWQGVAERITGVARRATIHDMGVRAADEQQVVDMTRDAVRRRLALVTSARPTRSTRQ